MSIATLGVAASEPEPSSSSPPSPAAELDLICHTNNPDDCYPKIFQPTDEFQTVHDDQDLPPGLHVRLNVWTGEKEAKINVPGEQDSSLDGLPVDSSVVVVEPEQGEEEATIPPGAPAYEPVGKIKKPAGESGAFFDSLEILKKNLDVDSALEALEDISHDIYYGLKIAENYEAVRSLFCLADAAASDSDVAVLGRARLAALTIAGAVQNNAKALAEVETHWGALKSVQCPASRENLGTAAFRLLPPQTGDKRSSTGDLALVKAKTSAIKGLIKSPVIRKDFLENGGPKYLLEALVLETKEAWGPAQKKIALLVQDIFLDKDMGAVIGEWPRDDQASDEWCSQIDGDSVSEKCWDWEMKRLVQQHGSDKEHWSVELWDWVKEARRALEAASNMRTEL